jgi:hypothetical protein
MFTIYSSVHTLVQVIILVKVAQVFMQTGHVTKRRLAVTACTVEAHIEMHGPGVVL